MVALTKWQGRSAKASGHLYESSEAAEGLASSVCLSARHACAYEGVPVVSSPGLKSSIRQLPSYKIHKNMNIIIYFLNVKGMFSGELESEIYRRELESEIYRIEVHTK